MNASNFYWQLHVANYFCGMKNSCFILLLLLLTACGGNDDKDDNVSTTSTTEHLEGKQLFYAKCASCHMVNKELTGPALRGVEARWPDTQKLYAFIRNSEAFIKEDKYAHELWLKYNQTMMNKHPDLTDSQIRQILDYINSVSEAANP